MFLLELLRKFQDFITEKSLYDAQRRLLNENLKKIKIKTFIPRLSSFCFDINYGHITWFIIYLSETYIRLLLVPFGIGPALDHGRLSKPAFFICNFIFQLIHTYFTSIHSHKMKADTVSDGSLQSMLSQYPILEPNIECEQGLPITKICTNHKCLKPSLMCEDDHCSTCGDQNHLYCSTYKLKAITKLLNSRGRQQRQLSFQLLQIQNSFVQQLHKNVIDLARKLHLGGLSEKHFSIVEDIYKRNNNKCLIGKEADDFVTSLCAMDSDISKKAQKMLEIFKKSLNSVLEQIFRLKYTFLEQELQQYEEESLHSLNQKPEQIISSIPKDQFQFLMHSLGKPKGLSLLYRGSQNNFSAPLFHQKCDSIPNTLTLVRTQFGKTIAGFTKYTWNAVSNTSYVNDPGRNTFLLSLDLKQKMVPISDKNLILCFNALGPTFGNGFDLHISNHCDKNRRSYANFPTSYNGKGVKRFIKSQQSFKALSGATQDQFFRVVEYQVFRVVYQDQ